MINLGIVGAGKFAGNYVRTLREFPNVKIVSYARQSPFPAAYMPESAILYTDWQVMLDQQQLDGLIVCADPGISVDVVHTVLSKSVPVMVEKPLAFSLREVARLSPLAKRAPLLVNHIHLFSSAYETLKKMVDPDRITYIESEGSNSGPIRSFSSLYDYGPHDLSMCLDLIGRNPNDISCFKTQCENRQLFDIIMNYDGLSTYSRVGNAGTERRRNIIVKSNDQVYVYDDTTEEKLFVDNIPVPISPDPPLKRAISLWIRAISQGAIDDRLGLSMALRIAAVLDVASKQV